MIDSSVRNELLDRFIRYASIGTQSDPDRAGAGTMPSTESQRAFAESLAGELRALGAEASVDGNGYVLARVAPSAGLESVPPFGLSAHLDTSSEAPGDGVRPVVHERWNGETIRLADGLMLDPAKDAELASCVGHTIITSDGTTLLGADDKAGLAAIMTLVSVLSRDTSVRHGEIEILFSPDEETGHGMDKVPLDRVKSKFFYTVDGGHAGEIEAECFNAWRCDVTFTGVSAHLGTAKGKMVNAVTMASSFVTELPADEAPETTEGREGYFCPLEITGGVETASVTVFLRDFELAAIEKKIARVGEIAEGIRARFPRGSVDVRVSRQYLNMRDRLRESPEIVERLEKAVRAAGIEPVLKPIRGGTDGSRLTEMGIPTPNVFTGGHNYHSRTEWASLDQMESTVRTLVELARVRGE